MPMTAVDFIDALTSDCRLLLARFEEKQSVRFEDFCEVWKELKFSLIHHVTKQESERSQVAEWLFRILGNYLLPACPFQYQVGAIYAIYSVYHTQLVTPKVKIRMTLSMWNDLMNFQEEIKQQKHYDVYYVISSLRADKAFSFVAMPIQLACGSRDAITQFERDVVKESKSSNAVKNAQEIINNVNEIDELYNSAKMKICSPEEGQPLVDPVTLKVVSSDLVSNLQCDVKDFETWKKTSKDSLKVKHMQRALELGLPDERNKGSDTENKGTSRADLVNEIKERSFQSVAQVSKGKRRYQPVAESPKKTSTPQRKTRRRITNKDK